MATYTLASVAFHCTDSSLWVIVNDHILDLTEFASEHPGGSDVLLAYAGKDATDVFNRAHPGMWEHAKQFIIGKVEPEVD